MNKNWLYRVLALALVAMLALPVFAMAEEQAEFQLGEGEVVEVVSKAIELDPDGGNVNVFGINFDLSRDYTLEVDVADGVLDFFVFNDSWSAGDFIDPDDFDYWTADAGFTSYKSSNHKVATIDKHGHITIKGKGKSTITLKGKNNDGKVKTRKISLTVKNGKEAKKVVIRKPNGDKAAKTEEVALGNNAAMAGTDWTTEAEDSNGDVLDPATEAPNALVRLKSANGSNVKITEPNGVLDNNWKIYVDTSKTHSTKLTATNYVNSKLTANTTIKVVKKEKEFATTSQLKLELARAKDANAVLVGVKKIKINRVKASGKLGTNRAVTDWYYDVTLYVANGIGHNIKKIEDTQGGDLTINFDYNVYGDIFDLRDGNNPTTVPATYTKKGSWSVNWKNNTVSTEKITLQTNQELDLSKKYVEMKITQFNFQEKGSTYTYYKGE